MVNKLTKERKGVYAIVVSLLAVMFFQAVLSMRLKSMTFDETSHLPSGYTYLKTGDFRLNREHPPLIKLLSGMPLCLMKLNLPLYSKYWMENTQYQFGLMFLYYSGNDAGKMIFYGRIPIVLLALLLGYFIFLWAEKLYGTRAGLLALFLYVFSPNMLAHSRLVAMDFGLGCFMLIACYFVWSYLEKPSVWRLLLSGIFTGLTLVTKFSGVMLIPVFLVMACFRLLAGGDVKELFLGVKKISLMDKAWFLVSRAMVISIISVVIIYMAYGFSGDALVRYKEGMDLIYWNQSQGYKFYLGGKFSLDPWWYYYVYAFFLKTPLPAMAMMVMAITRKKNLYKILWLLVTVLIVVVISFFDKRNLGLRRILPVYPFLFVFISGIAAGSGRIIPEKWKPGTIAVTVLCAWYAISSLMIYPDYLAYFNELAGGPAKGIYHLDDSNIDWGQDLKQLKLYMDEKGIPEIKLLYYGTANADYYGIKTVPSGKEDITGPVPGHYYAISAHYLLRLRLGIIEGTGGVDWLGQYEPVDIIGHTIYIYKV